MMNHDVAIDKIMIVKKLYLIDAHSNCFLITV